VDDHGDDHRLDPAQEALRLRQPAPPDVERGDAGRQDGCRQDEAHAGHDEPRPARPPVADVDRQLGRVRAGDEIRGPEEIDELLAGEPAAPPHRLLLHHGDVGRRTAEGHRAEPQEEQRHLAQDADARVAGGRPHAAAAGARAAAPSVTACRSSRSR
jgi:hypothetical protein